MRKITEEAWKKCPRCGKIEDQIKAVYNIPGSQRCKYESLSKIFSLNIRCDKK